MKIRSAALELWTEGHGEANTSTLPTFTCECTKKMSFRDFNYVSFFTDNILFCVPCSFLSWH